MAHPRNRPRAARPLLHPCLTAVEKWPVPGGPSRVWTVTVFGSGGRAFAALPPGTVQTLVQNPYPSWLAILKFTVISGAHTAAAIWWISPLGEPGGGP